MRRPRHKLQVSTFPFLAVLLGAMGALILLLLVMDRRSKIVARNKAQEIHSQLLAARAKSTELTKQQEEARRADWERKRQEIHDLLAAQENELSHERAALDAELAKLSHDSGDVDKTLSELEKAVIEQRARLDLKSQLLNQMRQGIARTTKLDEASKLQVEKLALELASLERTLQEAKALRLQKQETYSLVPYRGKLGEGRRPVYVECTAGGLVFHPERQRLEKGAFDTANFRAEVQHRGIELVREQHDPERPNRPPAPRPTTAYVLFLVRPDGLESYYEATAALRGFDLDFGYEFVNADWVFDFSQPANFAANRSEGARGERRETRSEGRPATGRSGGSFDSIGFERGTSAGEGGASAATGGSLGAPQLGNVGNGNTGSRFVPVGQQRGPLGGGYAQASGSQGPPGTGSLPRLGPIGGNSVNGTANGAGTLDRGPAQAFLQPAPPGVGLAVNSGDPSANARGPGSPSVTAPNNESAQPASAGQTLSQDVSWRGSPGATPQAVAGAGQTHGNADGNSGADSGSADPRARLSPPPPFDVPAAGPRKTSPPPSLGRLFANRDYVLTVECFANVVAVYPSSQVFSVANGPQQENTDAAMVQAVRQLITRRQATVRAGEAPYRPMLRFQVHPDALRTYFHVYPLFEGLHIPMARENLPS